MEYPEEVVTTSKKGEKEARIFLEKGKFVKYTYRKLKDGKLEKKVKLVLMDEDGNILEEFFIIPLKDKNRFLLLKSEIKGKRKVFDEKSGKIVEI